MDERDDLPTTDRLTGQRISYLKYFDDRFNPKFHYYFAHVMANLFGRRSMRRPSLTDIYSGLTPSAGRGYDTVSTSSLYDPTRLKTDSGVLFL